MARVKGGYVTRQRRNRTLKLAKGYYGAKSKLFKQQNKSVRDIAKIHKAFIKMKPTLIKCLIALKQLKQ